MLGTPDDDPAIKELLQGDGRITGLGTEGYILKVARRGGRPVLLATGRTISGVQNAVSEIVSWQLGLDKGQAWVRSDLDICEVPALKYRLLWNWDMRTNWESSLETMQAGPRLLRGYQIYTEEPNHFLTHFKRAVDFFGDHKLNGLVIWGFLRDEHGGIDAARELSRYARQRNVRILPGVCTEAVYGGFTFSRASPYNLDHRGAHHPELQFVKQGGSEAAGICPSKPENQQWLRDGIKWFFETLPDIGGANLENGDCYCCQTDDCREARARPGQEASFYWDQAMTYRPVVETAAEVRPDAWMLFATYSSFNAGALPRYVAGMPGNAVCQWTLTGLTPTDGWPESLRPPQAGVADHIGYLKLASTAVGPSRATRWWAGPPGGAWDEVAELIATACRRIHAAGMQGLVLYGELGAASPANELNYLALEHFSWSPQSSWDEFVTRRLSVCYGGEDRSRLFVRILRDETSNRLQIRANREEALALAQDASLDIRQRQRWGNLAVELARRAEHAAVPAEGSTQGVPQ